VGTTKYKSKSSIGYSVGNKSNRYVKNNTSAINIKDPGKPKKTSKLASITINNFGHK